MIEWIADILFIVFMVPVAALAWFVLFTIAAAAVVAFCRGMRK